MNHLFALRNHNSGYFGGYALLTLWALWLCSGSSALAQSPAAPANTSAPFSPRVTHLLGLPNTKRNCNGTLSIQDNVLQFEPNGKPGVQVNMASILDLSSGDESKQVGGLPMKLGKAAAPYGGGRVVSLFAHKKYDTLALEYVDGDGGVHGAIFELKKGQGELLKDELLARGASSSSDEGRPARKSTVEVTRENK
jgi:hypothetical protein